MGPHTSTYTYAPPEASSGPMLFKRSRQPAPSAINEIPGIRSKHERSYSIDTVRRSLLELNVTDEVMPASHSLEGLRAAHAERRGDVTPMHTVGNVPVRGHMPAARGDASTSNIHEAMAAAGAEGTAPGDAPGALPDFVDVMDQEDFDMVASMASRSHMTFRLLRSTMATGAAPEAQPLPSDVLHTEDLYDRSRLEAQASQRKTAQLADVQEELETLYHCVLRRTAKENTRGTPSLHTLEDVPHLYRTPSNHTAEGDNGRECFIHLTALLAQLNASDLEAYAAPRLQTGANSSSVLIDALFELASPAAQNVVARDLLQLKEPNAHLVARALHAVVYLSVPEPSLVAAVERLAFHAVEDDRARSLRTDDMLADALLALGTLVRRLRESGRCQDGTEPKDATHEAGNNALCHRLLEGHRLCGQFIGPTQDLVWAILGSVL